MKVFSYKDYIRCIHTLRLNAVLQLAEESTEYKLDSKDEENNKHDKLAKTILKDKKEMAKFINQFLEPIRKVESRDLEKYTNSYIIKKYKNKEEDLFFKLKSDEIFFLVKHQSSIDYTMPYRILNYCIDIMQECSRNKKIDNYTRYPIIVPIVIYTGQEKWRMPKKLKEKQIGNYVLENYKIDLEYNFISINKLSIKYLLQKRTMFGYGMIIEKAKNMEELTNNLELVIENAKTKKQLDQIEDIIIYLFDNSVEKKAKYALVNKIKREIEKEGKNMSARDIVIAEMSKQRQTGRIDVAEGMIRSKVDDKIIMKCAKITPKELDKLKRTVLVNK